MINKAVIKEIYKKFGKPKKGRDLQLPYFIGLLSPLYKIKEEDDRVIFEDMEEFNPFRMFLKRNLNIILEFDREIAFVFHTHIVFLNRENINFSIDVRLDERRSFFDRLFGR